jgi:hypothetical protein
MTEAVPDFHVLLRDGLGQDLEVTVITDEIFLIEVVSVHGSTIERLRGLGKGKRPVKRLLIPGFWHKIGG